MASGRIFRDKRVGVRRRHQAWLVLALSALATIATLSSAQNGVVDLDGKAVDPLKSNAGRIVVLLFVRDDCPISRRYAPTIRQISANHASDARFYLVFPDKTESTSAIREFLTEFRYGVPSLRDPAHLLVKAAQAEVTPEAAVFSPHGDLVYRGRIDNLYETFGRPRPAPTTHELEDAIETAIAGRPQPVSKTTAIGCYISDLD